MRALRAPPWPRPVTDLALIARHSRRAGAAHAVPCPAPAASVIADQLAARLIRFRLSSGTRSISLLSGSKPAST
ncbi:hypothetical protein, partial [Xanthomonas citri]|uniref:hypothetical protein n=1 Tax=Xanthomonas citri TaxID=346 RepID=UPI001CC10274